MKFGAKTNSYILNQMLILEFSLLGWKNPFWVDLDRKRKVFSLRCMLNSMMIFKCSLLDWKYPFWLYFVQKGKIAWLRCSLAPRLIQTGPIRWWCSLSCFRPEIPFLERNLDRNCNVHFSWIICVRWNWVLRPNRICGIRWWCSNVLLWTWNIHLMKKSLMENFIFCAAQATFEVQHSYHKANVQTPKIQKNSIKRRNL